MQLFIGVFCAATGLPLPAISDLDYTALNGLVIAGAAVSLIVYNFWIKD